MKLGTFAAGLLAAVVAVGAAPARADDDDKDRRKHAKWHQKADRKHAKWHAKHEGHDDRGRRNRVRARRGRMNGLDRNRDGVVSRAEWRGSVTAFRRLDRNGDGVIGRREWR